MSSAETSGVEGWRHKGPPRTPPRTEQLTWQGALERLMFDEELVDRGRFEPTFP